MATGWLQLDRSYYCLEASGAIVTGNHWANGVPRTFDDSGVWIH